MNLLKQAEADLSFTLEDSENGFGVELTLIDEDLNEYEIKGMASDIGFFFDPESGIGVVGRQVTITIRISSLEVYPTQNWKCTYKDTNNNIWNCFIAEKPKTDRTLGVYLITLEAAK